MGARHFNQMNKTLHVQVTTTGISQIDNNYYVAKEILKYIESCPLKTVGKNSEI